MSTRIFSTFTVVFLVAASGCVVEANRTGSSIADSTQDVTAIEASVGADSAATVDAASLRPDHDRTLSEDTATILGGYYHTTPPDDQTAY